MMLAYVLVGPLLVGQIGAGELGMLWITRITIGFSGEYTLSLFTYIFGMVFMLAAIIFLQADIFINGKKHGKGGWTLFFIYFVIIGIGFFLSAVYFGWYSPLLNPLFYLYLIGPILQIRKTIREKNHNLSSKNGV